MLKNFSKKFTFALLLQFCASSFTSNAAPTIAYTYEISVPTIAIVTAVSVACGTAIFLLNRKINSQNKSRSDLMVDRLSTLSDKEITNTALLTGIFNNNREIKDMGKKLTKLEEENKILKETLHNLAHSGTMPFIGGQPQINFAFITELKERLVKRTRSFGKNVYRNLVIGS